MLPFRLALLFLLIATSTVLHVIPLLAIAVLKVVLPLPRLRTACNPLLTGLAASWIGFNNWLWDSFTRTRLRLRGDADLHADGHYLVLANHQSWVDILVLQKVFNRRIPAAALLPQAPAVLGAVAGAGVVGAGFPVHGSLHAAAGGEEPGAGRARHRGHPPGLREVPCDPGGDHELRRGHPLHRRPSMPSRASPYRHLLKPKSGGVAFVLDAMGEGLHAILDVTIAYPGGRPSLVDLLADRVPEVRVQVRQRPIPVELAGGDYQNDREFRVRFQQWMNGLWCEKDEDLAAMLEPAVATPDDGSN